MDLSLGLTITRPAVLSIEGISAVVNPVAEAIVDGESLNDLPNTATYLSPANYTPTDGETINPITPTITRSNAGQSFPSSLSEVQEQGDVVTLAFTVTDTGGASRSYSLTYTVFPVATVATAGDLVLDLDLNTGVVALDTTAMFEPVTASENWTVPTLSLSGAPVGVSLVNGQPVVDTDVLAEQTNTTFDVIATDSTILNGVTTVRTATKGVDLSAAANVITPTVLPAFAAGFAGGSALADSNRATILDVANYTNLTSAAINVRLRVNNGPAEILTYQWQTGDVARLIVDIWNNGGTVGVGDPDAQFSSADMTVQQLLTLSATSGTSLSVTTNASAPDAYPVNGVLVNGRDLDAGLTVADFERAQMQLIQSPLFAAPDGVEEGEFTVYTPPMIVAPSGAAVTVTYDLIDDADDSVILADVSSTDPTISDEITSVRLGLTVFWRAKFRAAGLVDLDVDSDAIAIASGVPVVPHAPLAEWDLTDPANLTVDGSNNVTGVTDLTGNGYDLTPIDSPLYVPAAAHLLGHVDFENGALVIPGAMTTDVNDVTVFIVTTANFFEADRPAKTWLSLDETEFSLMRNNNANLGVFMSGNNNSDLTDRDNVTTLYVVSSATDLAVGVDNDTWAKGSAGAGADPTVGGFIGRFRGSDNFRSDKGKAHAAIVYNKVLTTAEIADVRTYLAQKYNAPAPLVYDLICEGDSITEGAQATSEEYSYPSQLQRLYVPGTAPSVRNSGVSGSQVETNGAEVIEMLDTSGLPTVTVPRVVFFLWGNNDFAAGNTAAQLEAEYEAAWAAIRAAHPDVHIGVGSVLPTQRYDPDPRQNDFNARLAETGPGAMTHDFFIDTNAIPELNPPTVGTYVADTVGHLTDAGYGVLAVTVKAGIDAYVESL